MAQQRIDDAIDAGKKLTGLIQKNDYSDDAQDQVAALFVRIDATLDTLPEHALKTEARDALDTFHDAYDQR
jgi:hypothetical protein